LFILKLIKKHNTQDGKINRTIFIRFIFLAISIICCIGSFVKGIKNALESAEEAKKEMQSLNADNERILNEARAERDALLKDAREIKEKIISDAKEDAQEQASGIIDAAKSAIEVEKQAAISHLKSQVANLSIEIAEKVVQKELAAKDDQLALVDKMLGDVILN
jgi:F-type H+-transporting ATPase subunit b